jgi:hypothetical protein
MEKNTWPALVAGVLTLAVAIIFKSFYFKTQSSIPLFLVPTLLYVGYLVGRSPKIWMALTTAITVALAVLYAM